jgi:glycosyltransferase involved in cell wall biosynthesis
MHIVFVVNSIYESGGLERVVSERSKALIDNYNYKVSIVSLESEKDKKFYFFHNKITFYEIKKDGKPSWFEKKRKVKRCLKEIKPDVITICDDGLKGLFFPLIHGVYKNIIYERHASKKIFLKGTSIKSKLQYRLKSFLADFGSLFYKRVIFLTDSNKKEWPFANAEVIPNFISSIPNNKALLENKKVIAVGGHSYSKGFDRLLLIWKEIVVRHPDWQLHIFGRINNQKIIKLCKSLNLDDGVVFHLPTSNLIDEYLDSSIFTMTSRSEGFGMVLIEAMSCGVPCIAFDCPSGPREIIKHNEDGYLIKNGDLNSYCEYLLKLIENPELRNKMGSSARERVKCYLPEPILKQWDELFKSLAQ